MSPFDVAIGPHRLPGQLCLPPDPRGLILFAHGSGSSRFSPRNQFVAEAFQRGAFATLLFDLLHENEAEDRHNVFDIGLLGSRVVEAIDWTQKDDRTFALPLGLFGASTGAAAALSAAATRKNIVGAVVSRGGRPDLAEPWLDAVRAPTLLIVGGDDGQVLALNRAARRQLRCPSKLTVIPGASHLFEEAGALEAALTDAMGWFEAHLQARNIVFDSREAAGRLLASALLRRAPSRPLVFALPRGGAAVAAEIARALDAPLDLILSRKIGAPRQPELALGAAVDGDQPEIVLNHDIVAAYGVGRAEIERLASRQFAEIERRRDLYLGDAPPISAQGRSAILVDDGIATGASMEAAIHALKRRGPQKIILAVPVAAREAAVRLGGLVDETIALLTPETFFGIGEFYRDFHQLEDEEVITLMKSFAAKRSAAGD
ncbi:MAG: phosphoribosyltransferase family protein [Rhodoblastus sp.]|uniref:phosphoribosyltransferase family protein n=1 Tax=Rhodoblastus sp. TaxID=1962975 RepID=UPI003F9B4A92